MAYRILYGDPDWMLSPPEETQDSPGDTPADAPDNADESEEASEPASREPGAD